MTETRTLSLTDFLSARIAEDERDANEEDRDFADTALLPSLDSEHQQRWDTDRARAECAAKRKLIEDYAWLDADYRATRTPETEARRFQALIACARVAAIYADHPDYRDEWRP